MSVRQQSRIAHIDKRSAALPHWLVAVVLLAQLGCGSIREHRATNQLLLSDAVDRSVAKIDFGPLAYETVFLDSRYLQFKNDSAVTTNYVISSLRQQMIVAGCLLQDRIEDAKYVVEARVGTMGADGHDINYGIPASNSVNAAASIVAGAPPLPALPEISLARRTEDMAAVKIAAFAYDRETRLPVWQSGTSLARSEALSTWVLGAGPFKKGSIYKKEQSRVGITPIRNPFKKREDLKRHDYVYREEKIWDPDLLEKMQSDEHLTPPSFRQLDEEADEAVEVADTSDASENAPQ